MRNKNMNIVEIAILVLPSFARIIEAIRDAEQFERPYESRSILWHFFKLPQFAIWGLYGSILGHCYYHGLKIDMFLIVGSLVLAFAVFEISLKMFRKDY